MSPNHHHDIPTRDERPDGLYQRYRITKADGRECDPRAVYFVLRLDRFGDDPGHIAACRAAARIYAANAPPNMAIAAGDLLRLLEQYERYEVAIAAYKEQTK